MKANWPTTLLALFLSWLTGLLIVALVITIDLVIAGQHFVERVGGAAFIWVFVGLFALVGWLFTILPLITSSHAPLLRRPVVAEGTWAAAAVLAYVVLVAPWAGLESLLVIWVPALLGIVAGVYYRRLSRKTGPPVSE
jgi:hypothetical protein